MNKYRQVAAFILVIVCRTWLCECGYLEVSLTNNGYTGVVIAIKDGVPEDPNLIDSIKEMMVNASRFMLVATQQRAYFKKVTILVPKSWTSASYTAATTETYLSAAVQIELASPSQSDIPYTRVVSGCGKPGEYIHLTDKYVASDTIARSTGPRGKALVHEWAHYRWGVLDEYPTSEENQFYIGPNGYAQATRCSAVVDGVVKNIFTGDDCAIDPTTRLPPPDCYFEDADTSQYDSIGSIMYKQRLSHVLAFCNNNASDPAHFHNVDAKNDQNLKCNSRSTWEVIMESEDFQNGTVNNPNISITNTTPDFRVLRAEPKRIILVLDVSGSMAGAKMDAMRASAKFLIDTQPDYTSVGLVDFSTAATLVAYPAKLSRNARKTLINLISNDTGGYTAIGSGIIKGIEALRFLGSPDGGILYVITDGEENRAPFVANVADEVFEDNVIVNTIFIGLEDVDQDATLVQLSEESQGGWRKVEPGQNLGSQLHNALASFSHSVDGNLADESLPISYRSVAITNGSTVEYTIAIDGSIGNNTIFSFTWSNAEPRIEIKPPQQECVFSNVADQTGKFYCAENPIHVTDARFKNVMFTIPGTAEVGRWKYNITSSVDDIITVAIVSTSSGGDPITVQPLLTSTSVSGNQTVAVVVKVFQNQLPVTGANVTAIIERPHGENIELQLYDNGAGADFKKNDGVYSRYFTKFNARGRYSVEVYVVKTGDDENSTTASQSDSFNINDIQANFRSGNSAKVVGTVERIASAPGLEYTSVPSTEDTLPPNKITDLTVVQADLDKASDGIILEFTAPGDDYDEGTANRYEIRYTLGDISDILNDFAGQVLISENAMANGNMNSPKPALDGELFVIYLTNLPNNMDSVRIAFAVQSFDEAGNPSEVSNVAVVRFFTVPPPIPRNNNFVETTTEKESETTTVGYHEATPGMHKSSNLVIILPAVGGAIVLIAIIVIAVLFYRRRNKRKDFAPSSPNIYENTV